MVEKAFNNIKERLNGNRALVSSEAALEGKLFVHFLGLFLLSYIKKQMQEHQLFSKYTIPSLLDELGSIEMIHILGKTPWYEKCSINKFSSIEPWELNRLSASFHSAAFRESTIDPSDELPFLFLNKILVSSKVAACF